MWKLWLNNNAWAEKGLCPFPSTVFFLTWKYTLRIPPPLGEDGRYMGFSEQILPDIPIKIPRWPSSRVWRVTGLVQHTITIRRAKRFLHNGVEPCPEGERTSNSFTIFLQLARRSAAMLVLLVPSRGPLPTQQKAPVSPNIDWPPRSIRRAREGDN